MGKRKCKQCGEEFTLIDSEIKFYNDKGLNLPKRCSECRKKNKNINNWKSNLTGKVKNKAIKLSLPKNLKFGENLQISFSK